MQDTHLNESIIDETLQKKGEFQPDWRGCPGVLLLHGFTSSLDAVSGLVPELEEMGIPYEMPVLRGHNTTPDDLVGVRYSDWYEDALAALKKLSERADHIVVVGLSMGGLVALNLCAGADAVCGNGYPEDDVRRKICGCVTWAAALGFCNPFAWLAKPLSLIFHRWPGQDSFHDPECRKNNHNYSTFPTSAFCELYDFAARTSEILGSVKVPLCIIHSERDQVVPFKKSLELYEKCGSAYCEHHALKRSGHELGQDMERESVFKLTAAFLKNWMP